MLRGGRAVVGAVAIKLIGESKMTSTFRFAFLAVFAAFCSVPLQSALAAADCSDQKGKVILVD